MLICALTVFALAPGGRLPLEVRPLSGRLRRRRGRRRRAVLPLCAVREMKVATAVRELPVLFTSVNVGRIQEDLKDQTRRVIKPQPPKEATSAGVISGGTNDGEWSWLSGDPRDADTWGCVGESFRCPYGQPSDGLYVRETHWRYGSWVKRYGIGEEKTTKRFVPWYSDEHEGRLPWREIRWPRRSTRLHASPQRSGLDQAPLDIPSEMGLTDLARGHGGPGRAAAGDLGRGLLGRGATGGRARGAGPPTRPLQRTEREAGTSATDLPPRVVPHPMLVPAPVEGREGRASSGTRATA